MRNTLATLTIGIAITAVGAFAADNSLGTWKLNMDKSKFTPSAPVKSLTSNREAAEGGVKVTTTGERADGTPINGSYAAKYDSKSYPVTGAPYDSIALKQVNANTFTVEQKNSGTKYSTTVRIAISKDGKTMTSKLKGTDAQGTPIAYTMVYDKQ
jgi:hypothetical protein